MKTKEELVIWVCGVIESCTDDFHFEGAGRIIDLFHERYKDEALRDEIAFKMREKWNKIHGIIAPQNLTK